MASVVPLLLLCSCDQSQPREPSNEPTTVTVAAPLREQVVEWDAYTGRLEPLLFVEIRARVSGYLQSIHFTEGQLVKAGDLLFVIDPRPFNAALEQAEASRNQALAQLAKAQASKARAEAEQQKADASVNVAGRRFQRAKALLQTQAVATEEVDVREGEFLQAKADLEAARAGVAEADAAIATAKAAVETASAAQRTAKIELSYTKIRAPIAGRISDHRVTDGNLIGGGSEQSTLLTTITSIDPIHCTFDASESEVLKYIRLSQSGERQSSRETKNPVYLALADEKGFPHVGHMDFVDNRFDPNSATLRATAIFPNKNNDLIPGLFASVRIPGSGSYEAVLIPDKAVGTDQAKQFVLVVDDQNKVERTAVELGPMVNGLRVVRSGLTGSERIITRGLQRVRPGATVNPEVETLKATSDGLPDTYEPVPPENWLSLPPAAAPQDGPADDVDGTATEKGLPQ